MKIKVCEPERKRNSLVYSCEKKKKKIYSGNFLFKNEKDDGSEKVKQSLSQALPMNSMSKRRTEAGGIRHEPAQSNIRIR